MSEQERIAEGIRKIADQIQEAYRYQGGGSYAMSLRAFAALVAMLKVPTSSSEENPSGSPTSNTAYRE